MSSNQGKIIGTDRHHEYPLVSLIDKQFRRKMYESGPYTVVELQIDGIRESQKEKLIQDIEIMKVSQQSSIVQIHQHFPEDQFYYIIIGGDCKKTFKNYFKGKRCQQNTLLSKIKELVQANKQLSKNDSLVRDFKPSNVFMPERKYQAVLADFDVSKFISQPNNIVSQTPTNELIYMSPQMLKGSKYTQKSGVWSLGIMLFQILTNRLPWDASTSEILLQNMQKKELRFDGVYVSEKTKKLLNKMLEYQERKRIGMDQLENEIKSIVEIYTLPSRQKGKSLINISVKKAQRQQCEDSLQKYERKNMNVKRNQENIIKKSKVQYKNKLNCQVIHSNSCQLFSTQSVPKSRIIQSQNQNEMKFSFAPTIKKVSKDQRNQKIYQKQNSRVTSNRIQNNFLSKQNNQNFNTLNIGKKRKVSLKHKARENRLLTTSKALHERKLQQQQTPPLPLTPTFQKNEFKLQNDSSIVKQYKAKYISNLIKKILQNSQMSILLQYSYRNLPIDGQKYFQRTIKSFQTKFMEQARSKLLLS